MSSSYFFIGENPEEVKREMGYDSRSRILQFGQSSFEIVPTEIGQEEWDNCTRRYGFVPQSILTPIKIEQSGDMGIARSQLLRKGITLREIDLFKTTRGRL